MDKETYKTGTYGKDEEDVRKRLKKRKLKQQKRRKDQELEWKSNGMERTRSTF